MVEFRLPIDGVSMVFEIPVADCLLPVAGDLRLCLPFPVSLLTPVELTTALLWPAAALHSAMVNRSVHHVGNSTEARDEAPRGLNPPLEEYEPREGCFPCGSRVLYEVPFYSKCGSVPAKGDRTILEDTSSATMTTTAALLDGWPCTMVRGSLPAD